MNLPRRSWKRPEHAAIARVLAGMDGDWLLRNRCWFGGGTAVVMTHGEYRLSTDIDFLCDHPAGYRELRLRAVRQGVKGFFSSDVTAAREFRCDQYGLRCALDVAGHVVRFEIVREARISLSGYLRDELGVPLLSVSDQIAEKLLANADRGLDRASAYRDVLDLGFLLDDQQCFFPTDAVAKVELAYGAHARAMLDAVLSRLASPAERRETADILRMEPADVDLALARVTSAAAAWAVSRSDDPDVPAPP